MKIDPVLKCAALPVSRSANGTIDYDDFYIQIDLKILVKCTQSPRMPEWKETAMSLKKKLNTLHKLYSKEKEYRQKLTATIYSLQDQLEEHNVQSVVRHDELDSKYQRQIQKTKAAEARSQSLEQEVTALQQDQDAKLQVIEKLQQQLRASKLPQKTDSESDRSDKSHIVNGQSLRDQISSVLTPDLETAANASSQSHVQVNKFQSDNRSSHCTQCDSSFTVKESLKRHIQSVHEKQVNYRCSYCSKGFYGKSTFINHLRVHKEERSFQCTICAKAFKQKSVLWKHMLFVHSDKKPFQCTQCDASFKRKCDLMRHLATHLDKFECDFCAKRFKTRRECRTHVGKFHSDDRPFQCNLCDSTFKWKGALERHTQSVHEKEVNFRCSHCSKGFYLKGNLTRHLRVHTGEKPFQCTVCCKAFTQRSSLTRHGRIHSGEKP